MDNQFIINDCWWSVPLPCGQYMAIFRHSTTISKRTSKDYPKYKSTSFWASPFAFIPPVLSFITCNIFLTQSATPRSSFIRWKDKSEITPIVGLADPECSDRTSKSLDWIWEPCFSVVVMNVKRKNPSGFVVLSVFVPFKTFEGAKF